MGERIKVEVVRLGAEHQSCECYARTEMYTTSRAIRINCLAKRYEQQQ